MVYEGLVQELQASRQRLLSVVSGVTEEQFKRRPAVEHEAAAGVWSIAEALAHLLGAEQRQAERLEALLAGRHGSPVTVGEEERNAEARQGRAVPVPQIIHGLLATRRRIEKALGETDASTASEAVSRLVREDVIAHEAEHTAQIETVRSVLGASRGASSFSSQQTGDQSQGGPGVGP